MVIRNMSQPMIVYVIASPTPHACSAGFGSPWDASCHPRGIILGHKIRVQTSGNAKSRSGGRAAFVFTRFQSTRPSLGRACPKLDACPKLGAETQKH